jgi:spore maturation protein CgeB
MNVLIVDTTIYTGLPLLAWQPPKPGVTVSMFDEEPYIRPLHTKRAHKVIYRLMGRRPITAWALNARLLAAAAECRPDVVIVAKGAYVFPSTVRRLKMRGARVVNYATDDPFNERHAHGWLRAAIPEYDLYACTKRAIMSDVQAAGCERTDFVRFAYNPDLHFPERASTDSEARTYSSDVVFVGAADDDRLPFLDALLSIPRLRLALYGSRWERQPERYRRHARGCVVGRSYRLALSGAKVALGLLRAANRDRHAMRTFEIPACGAFLCAQRTDEHRELFREDIEAVFFDDPEQLKRQVVRYLSDDDSRARIAAAGFRVVTGGAHTYADRIVQMVASVTTDRAEERTRLTASLQGA